MQYDKDKVLTSFGRWKNVLESYRMPTWDELPAFDLYMDQVIVIMSKYMEIFNMSNDKDRGIVTSSMINNYVKLKIMPPPVKKRYSKVHIAYLLMISSLKQALSISHIQKVLPCPLPEDEVRKIYESFTENIGIAFHDTQEMIIKKYLPKIEESNCSEECMNNFVLQSSVFAGALRVLAEKAIILGIPPETGEEKK